MTLDGMQKNTYFIEKVLLFYNFFITTTYVERSKD